MGNPDEGFRDLVPPEPPFVGLPQVLQSMQAAHILMDRKDRAGAIRLLEEFDRIVKDPEVKVEMRKTHPGSVLSQDPPIWADPEKK